MHTANAVHPDQDVYLSFYYQTGLLAQSKMTIISKLRGDDCPMMSANRNRPERIS
jgi:hypothetical protein